MVPMSVEVDEETMEQEILSSEEDEALVELLRHEEEKVEVREILAC